MNGNKSQIELEKTKMSKQKSKDILDKYELNFDNTFKYQMLGRLQEDCRYYLGFGGCSARNLWAHDERNQIDIMKALYVSFSDQDKPKWITMEDIEKYEEQMMVNYQIKKERRCNERDKYSR